MHQKNSNHVGSHHVEGFQDCFMYKEDRYAKTIDTRDESPCIFSLLPTVEHLQNSPTLGWMFYDSQSCKFVKDNEWRMEGEREGGREGASLSIICDKNLLVACEVPRRRGSFLI